MNTIGIDAMHLSCLEIKHIDWDVLERNTQATRMLGGAHVQHVWEPISSGRRELYKQCTCVLIEDGKEFYNCVIGVRMVQCRPIIYAKIRLTVHHMLGDNSDNLSRDDYQQYMQKIFTKYMPQQYGIYLASDTATVSYMEMNLDIALDYPYNQYDRVLKLLMGRLGRRYGDTCAYFDREDNKCTTLKRGNKSIEICMYNKVREMTKQEDPEAERILRIEFKLRTADKIQQLFKSRKWRDITQQKIVVGYHDQFVKFFYNPYIAWVEKTKIDLQSRIKEYIIRKNGRNIWERQWAKKLREELAVDESRFNQPIVLDIEQIEEVLKSMPDLHRNMGKKIMILKDCKKEINGHIFFNYDRLKVQEIFEKEQMAYENTLKKEFI